jgi:hypothetical protein
MNGGSTLKFEQWSPMTLLAGPYTKMASVGGRTIKSGFVLADKRTNLIMHRAAGQSELPR